MTPHTNSKYFYPQKRGFSVKGVKLTLSLFTLESVFNSNSTWLIPETRVGLSSTLPGSCGPRASRGVLPCFQERHVLYLYESLSAFDPNAVCPQLGQCRLLKSPRNDAEGVALEAFCTFATHGGFIISGIFSRTQKRSNPTRVGHDHGQTRNYRVETSEAPPHVDRAKVTSTKTTELPVNSFPPSKQSSVNCA